MEPDTLPHLLILEPDSRGHAREWFQHLIALLEGRDKPARLSFAIPIPLADALKDAVPASLEGRIDLLRLSERERKMCMHRQLSISGMSRWWVMRRYLKRTGASHGLFLGLDHLSLPLAMGLGAKGRPLSGILFRPSVHYAELGPYDPSLKERLRDLRKGVLYRLMMSNPSLTNILSLDPFFIPYARRHYAHSHKVVSMPDPIFPMPIPEKADHTLADRVPDDRILMVLFGELTERKGLLTLLDALALLSPAEADRLAIVIAGKIDAGIEAPAKDKMAQLKQACPALWCHIENRRLRPGEIASLVGRSQMILAPYQRFVGSSGILLWAINAGKPVLAQDYGLLGHLVRRHRLGHTLDTVDARTIAEAIGEITRGSLPLNPDTAAMARIRAQQGPARFAQIVLDRACSLPPCNSIEPTAADPEATG